MSDICAWCRNPLAPDDRSPEDILTHCVCRDCRKDLFATREPVPLQEYLDRLAVPILVLQGDGGIVTANHAACDDLGIDPRSIDGRLGGDALECINARLPGGCGKTEHCRTCTIRNTVTDTYRTSQSHYRVPAYADRETPDGVRRTSFLISTEKLGDLVVLRIDETRNGEPAPPRR